MATLKMGTDLKNAILNLIYPVGSIYITITATNPGNTMGGTWVAWGSGRVPVGVDKNQTEFNAVNKTGGAKTHTLIVDEMPSHSHRTGISSSEAGNYNAGSNSARVYFDQNYGCLTIAAGGGKAHNNLQPYITCYMWRRTA